MPRLAIGVLCAVLLAPQAMAEGEGPIRAREPSAEETLLLELVNRGRAGPQADAQRMVAGARQANWFWVRRVDFDLFLGEMSRVPPVAPLVFDLHLMAAADSHARYLQQNGLVTGFHGEERGRPGFTGETYGQRARAAGYPSPRVGENAGPRYDPWRNHVELVVDWGGGTGGMQPTRPHRRNLLRLSGTEKGAPQDYTEVGFAMVGEGHTGRLVQVFGFQEARFLGGVVYRDLDGDAFYDVGEGIGGASVVLSEGMATKTWASGAYALRLPEGAQRVVVTVEGEHFESLLQPTRGNQKLDVALATHETLQRIDEAIAAVAEAVDHERRLRKTALELRVVAYGVTLDAARSERVDALTAETWKRLAAYQRRVTSLYEFGDIPELRRTVGSLLGVYRDTRAEAWFGDAKHLAVALELKRALEKAVGDGATPSASRLDSALRKLRRAQPKLQSEYWKAWASALEGWIEGLR